MKPLFFLVIFLAAGGLFAQTYLRAPEAAVLGMTPAEAIASFGPPQSMYVQSAEEEWQRDIVFFYGDFSYLYWFDSRVWQIRFDYRHSDPILGIRMGAALSTVRGVLGQAIYEDQGELVYAVEDQGYPVRARFLFGPEGLNDIYIYRSDF